MNKTDQQIDRLVHDLRERAKELNCLYKIEELLNNVNRPLDELLGEVVKIIPEGWQYPDMCQAKITYKGKAYQTPGYIESEISQKADIMVQQEVVGEITVSYKNRVPTTHQDYFLKEESKLIKIIADRISHTILHKELKAISEEWDQAKKKFTSEPGDEWNTLLDMLHRTDRTLFIFIIQKMLYHLCRIGIEEARKILEQIGMNSGSEGHDDANRPSRKSNRESILDVSHDIFRLAAQHLHNFQILDYIQKWMQEDKSRFLVRSIDNPNSSLTEIIDAVTRCKYLRDEGFELSVPTQKGVRVSLARAFFSDQLNFINVAKNHLDIEDYYELVKRIIFPSKSHGKLGGKSAGLFLAYHIIKKSTNRAELFSNLKVPKTWYITSDGLSNFLYYNNLEEIIEQKYKEIDQIHIEYQNIVRLFKNSHFPPEIVKGLSAAIDDLGDIPIIVRSSSLLEDSIGAAFSGKYKSLFLANQGTKTERLDALMDAIAEVYASTFGPDPLEYRGERGLIDLFEAMGIMIQEVVGVKVGHYFLPAFSGVAFSNNEFRWSSRIKREDGLIRMVLGLGTRAVDRLSDDYPILVSPGQPDLRVNITPEEVIKYSPQKIDVINLKDNTFETVHFKDLLRQYGDVYPIIHRIVSKVEANHIQKTPSPYSIDFEKDDLIATFEGLMQKSRFLEQIRTLAELLQENIRTPVDIEFAHDGTSLYLLQCRPQSYAKEIVPAPIPKDIPEDKIIFSANRYVSNGLIPDITHIIFVDPLAYNEISDLETLKNVGRVVGKLNKVLPKRQFILMGPGRWGSRGDIKLGVSVTYADISNTAVLIEIARKKGNYTPDLSFGTHFFQDLVESSIRYLPLYPDEPDVVFNERFLLKSKNILGELIPEFEPLNHVVRVIDVPQNSDGKILRVLMNADLEEAVAILADPSSRVSMPIEKEIRLEEQSADYWRWRLYMAEKIAEALDPDRFNVKGLYIIGSTKNATAGPGSDIDLLIHFSGTKNQKRDLLNWLEGWSLTLSEMNYLRTGYRTEGLLDIHLITDDDIRNRTSFAVKIDAITDAARPLPLGKVK